MNRARLLVDGRPAWVTVPLDRSYHGVRSVREMRVDEAKPWRDRIEATIATAYANAPHVAQIHEVVANALRTPTNRMAEISESAIRLLHKDDPITRLDSQPGPKLDGQRYLPF